MTYNVWIEINGQPTLAGTIADKRFSYTKEYLASGVAAISLNLPLQPEAFDEARTKIFFDGLLPEGFTRRTVAHHMHVSEDDYISILAGLGHECIGAIRIDNGESVSTPSYRMLSLEEIKALAAEGTSKSSQMVAESHLSLAGASGKVGLYYNPDSESWYLPYGTAPGTHIVKQSHVRLGSIVVNELLCMRTAQKCGIEVPECSVISVGGHNDENILYATRRFDRSFMSNKYIDGLYAPARLHQEDFAQALGIPACEKYEAAGCSYLRQMFDLLRKHSQNPIEDQLKLWDMIVFSYLIGNTDNHLKNYSLLYSSNLSSVRLAPAYDIISTAIYENSTRHLAMRIGNAGTLDAVTEQSFEEAADIAGLGQKTAITHLRRIEDKFCKALEQSAEELTALSLPQSTHIAEEIKQNAPLFFK